MQSLIRERPGLSHHLVKVIVLRRLKDKAYMLTYPGYGGANTSVACAVNYLKRRGLNPLTHAQIAIICNRSRQTVTTVLNQLRSEADAAASAGRKDI